MDKIIGIGNALVDVLVRLESDALLAELGLEKGGMQLIDAERQRAVSRRMAAMQPTRATGGSAGNAVLALANLGAQPGFIGRVGSDEMGRFFAQNCTSCGIDARLVGPTTATDAANSQSTATVADTNQVGTTDAANNRCGATGVANTFISPDAERTFATYLGVAGELSPADITPELFGGYQLLHIEGYLVQDHALIRRICEVAQAAGLTLSIDLASYNVVRENLSLLRELVERYIDIVFANEEESAAFTQGLAPEEALQDIARLARVAVVKLGARGAIAQSGGVRASVPGQRVHVVDTTAAGDFFAGGFLYGLTHGENLQRCLELGGLLSGEIIQVVGTRLSEEKWKEIRRRIEEKRD